MNTAYISAFAALAGSAIGALASFATTWLTQHQQERATRLAQAMSRRERLYGEFVDEASRLLADALSHHLEEPSKMVPLYAIMGKLRLVAPANVVARADEVMGQIVEIYDLPNADFRNPADRPRAKSRRHPALLRRGLPGGSAALRAGRGRCSRNIKKRASAERYFRVGQTMLLTLRHAGALLGRVPDANAIPSGSACPIPPKRRDARWPSPAGAAPAPASDGRFADGADGARCR